MENVDWIPVRISKGMFSDEYAVTLKNAAGLEVSLFADKHLIKQEGNEAFLKVLLVRNEGAIKKVLLPTETFETGSCWLDVPR